MKITFVLLAAVAFAVATPMEAQSLDPSTSSESCCAWNEKTSTPAIYCTLAWAGVSG
jgi:hypothetical protein